MISDGGGDPLRGASPLQGPYWWLPVVISGLALVVSLLVPVINILLSRRNARRRAVRDALSSLLTPEVVRARVVVAKLAGSEHEFRHPSYIDGTEEQRIASNKEFDQFFDELRGATFTMMWAIQALVPTLRPYVERQVSLSIRFPFVTFRRGLGVVEAETVLSHVELMRSELEETLDDWGVLFMWHTTGQMTNQALSTLPTMLGHEERKLDALPLPPTNEEIKAEQRAKMIEELRQSRERAEERRAEKAGEEAATAEWEVVTSRWRPKVTPPRDLGVRDDHDEEAAP